MAKHKIACRYGIEYTVTAIGEKGAQARLVVFLKPLRPQPHWKPSEEDLTALEYCAEHTCPELLSLYLELKKL